MDRPETVKNHIWILSYGDIAPNTGYPEYENHSEPTIPAAPDPYDPNPQDGWTQNIVTAAPSTFPYAITGMARGYYYVTIFAEDASGNISDAPVTPYYRESISYWPGDVDDTPDGDVDVDDIALLSASWGLTPGNPIVDVGPSTDYARRSRPTPDNLIDIEDLMMFAMNYQNTDYEYYPRDIPELNPITVAMNVNSVSDLLTVTLELGENAGFVKGMDIPLNYGNGLQLQTVEIGEIWPEGSLLLHTDLDGTVTASIATLGALPLVEGNGIIATITFKGEWAATPPGPGTHDRPQLGQPEIEIVNNPVLHRKRRLGQHHSHPELPGPQLSQSFNPSTTIRYGLKESGQRESERVNARGQLVASLVNESKAAGTYEIVWNGKDSNGRPVSSGVYFFRMDTREGTEVQKGLMIK